MLDLDTVQHDIKHWIETFVEVPHPALGGWAPCPYARQARLNQEYQVQVGCSPAWDLCYLSQNGLGDKKVIVLAYEADSYSAKEFEFFVEYYNRLYLLGQNLLALPDHPADPETVNGVVMNQGTYALILVQSLPELNEKAQLVAGQNFYHAWPEPYLQQVFRHRQDPRS
jgi:hypothetical protein